MRKVPAAVLALTAFAALADCKTELPTQGALQIPGCDAKVQTCVLAEQALPAYLKNTKDDPAIFSVAGHASPWRFYDGQFRILAIEEMAQAIRVGITKKGAKRVLLLLSWSTVRPDARTPPLAARLAAALKDVPVDGMDGFLWLRADGSWRTTRQAFTMRMAGRYSVAQGEDIMVSLAAGWLLDYAEHILKTRDAVGMLRLGAAWDIYGLCPERALSHYEQAATLGNPVGGYNAALMRLERGARGDAEAAVALLTAAANAGDQKAQARLQALKR